jgi:hypothetical protein
MEEKTNEIFFFYTSDVFNFPIEFIFFSFIWFGKQKKHTKYNYFFDANLLIQSDCEFFLMMKIFEDKKKIIIILSVKFIFVILIRHLGRY